ncbi:hypothetical protein niasHT_025439 [Heterodera trifolii]|uniref:Uncharacterized protein n=1 Tax=Heterodera trifolii TaxID=157864 RepID=A0ABD2JWX7_9BILA
MAFPYVVNLCVNENAAASEAGTTYTFGAGEPIHPFLPLDERHLAANFLPYDLSQFFHRAEGGGHYALISLRMSGPDERQKIRTFFQRVDIPVRFGNHFDISEVNLFIMETMEWDLVRLKISNANFFKFCQKAHELMLVIWYAIGEIENGGTPTTPLLTPNQSPISSSLSASAGHSSASGNGSGHGSAVANSGSGNSVAGNELPSVEPPPQHEEE